MTLNDFAFFAKYEVPPRLVQKSTHRDGSVSISKP